MPLIETKIERIAPEPQPGDDRAPDALASGVAEPLAAELRGIVGAEGLLGRASDIVRYASDASPYRKLPQAVVRPRDVGQVAALMAYCRERDVPLVFRAGGTSLNGQSQTDGVLADVRHHWGGIEVLDDAAERVRVKPGAILGHVNRVLAPYGRKLGPDPASTDIATVGGVVANNSGGMRCGIVRDSYSTIASIKFALPSGTVIDTADPDAAERFERSEPELAAELEAIRDELRADADLRERVRRKFEIKNTTGYRLCAFLDADEPVEIFKRLLIGSEGTLAFIAEVVYETVPLPAVTTTAWAHFDSIKSATDSVPELVAAGATAVELMVAPALMVAANSIAGTPEYWKELPLESAALLIEFGAEDTEGLAEGEAAAAKVFEAHTPFREVEFSRDPERIEINWKVREGLHGLIGQFRAPGSALIVEDVCVPPARIAEAAEELRALLGEHGFLPGVAGHASAGNLHFMLTPDFGKPEDVERYETFIAALVELILDRYDGSLKAEHGTGVNMAPFVEREWGKDATELMWRIKRAADPETVLGPGVLLNRDPDCHLRDLKTTPEIEEVATKCVECGFCEPVCPSRGLTTTPRQRIVLRREMARQPAGSPLLRALLEEYDYDGLQTCAADGTCKEACPLGIDTGVMVKSMRGSLHGPREERAALKAAKRWAKVERAARGGLSAGAAVSNVIGDGPLEGVTGAARRMIGAELVPEWEPPMPPPAPTMPPPTVRPGAHAVYLPACVNRIFGRSASDYGYADGGAEAHSVPEALATVSARAGKPVWIPSDVAGTCCSLPWTSKAFKSGAEAMANATIEKLWRWSEEGELPVVIDATSCTHGLLEARDALTEENQGRLDAMTILDSIEWCGRHLLTDLEVTRKVSSAVLHPTCSSKHLGLDGELRLIAGAIAEEVVVPETATCCGFAGDRGFLHPELTAAATSEEAAEVRETGGDAHLCANRTCEIGLERATGERYESFVYLLERATRPS